MTARLFAAARHVGTWARRRWLLDARLPLAHLSEPGFVAIDLETTGLDPRRDAIVASRLFRSCTGAQALDSSRW